LAMPSAKRSERQVVLKKVEDWPCKVRSVPGIESILKDGVPVDQIEEVSIADLLGRDRVEPVIELMGACIEDKVVLVTGAGGSIGSELCRQVLQHGAKRLVMLESAEFNLYKIEKELSNNAVIPVLGNVQDEKTVRDVLEKYEVQTVYHAAAYKHVPIIEHSPFQGLMNNAIGTLVLAQEAITAGVENFVLISTDKAVRPTNVMGATKRLAEMILQALHENNQGATQFSMVRFGNVLGSSGSVVPLFREQIASMSAVTVTHPEINRFFMTIPEAVELVIQAGSMGGEGDVFVLDMGEPVKIVDLARRMIRLSGLEIKDADHPNGDIEIIFTGLRPGEKLYEELLIGNDVKGTDHPKIMKAQESFLCFDELKSVLQNMRALANSSNEEKFKESLSKVVDGYQ